MTQEISNNKAAVASYLQALKNDIPAREWPREGGVVEARLLKKGSRSAYFDLGRFGVAVVYGMEFVNAKEIVRDLSIGDTLPVKIARIDGEGGYIEVSLTEAGRQKLWQQVIDLQESGEIVKVKVAGINPGGLTVNLLDLKAFLPVSQMSPEHYPGDMEADRQKVMEELKKFVGEELSVKVVSVNPKKNKLVVSERDTVNVNLKELLAKYSVGQEVDGVVSGVADFGIFVRFVDNPQIEGLVHISEIDHKIIDNPKEVVSMNESVKVKIVDIREGRVFLSIKALKSDPWLTVNEKFKVGQVVKGKLYKFNPFGAVVNLEEGMQGLIHVTEFGGVDEMKKMLQQGEVYSFVVDSIKPEEKRLVLKLKK